LYQGDRIAQDGNKEGRGSIMYAVEMCDIKKTFGNVIANNNTTLRIKKGEIHSLLGENGAGKTTLMNILYGLYTADSGEIRINGDKAIILNPLHASQYKIAMVHQHFMLVDNMTVAENVVLGQEPHEGIRFNLKEAYGQVAKIAKEYGMKIDPKESVNKLSVGTKQRVEIVKALYRNADIIILDEPTAVLTPQEVLELFKVLRSLRDMGKTIIIITHKLRETLELADTVTILRKGVNVVSLPVAETNENMLAELMVGRLVCFEQEKEEYTGEPQILLQVKGLGLKRDGIRHLHNICFDLRAGEILGVAGVEGNGQTELIETLAGITRPTEGTVRINGDMPAPYNPQKLLRLGVGHIPEDRGKRGMVKEFSISENLILGYHHNSKFSKRGMVPYKALNEYALGIINEYTIACDGPLSPAGTLSGGNQQKVVIGRVFDNDPQIIIAAQPTRGVDVGAIEYIHTQLLEMRRRGKAILLISAELNEIVKLSDRIAVLYDGRFVSIGEASSYDEMKLGGLMTSSPVGERAGDIDGKKQKE